MELFNLLTGMYLYGAGGHAKVILDILKSSQTEVVGIFDDNRNDSSFMGYPVLDPAEIKGPLIISIGDNKVRKKIASRFLIEYESALAHSATVSSNAMLDVGTVVMQGVVIQSCVHIGKHCIINTSASVDHDSVLKDYVHISPGAVLCGNVKVDEGAWIGAGSTILPGVHIGAWSIIGAGSVVTKDIPANVIAFGHRCEIIKTI